MLIDAKKLLTLEPDITSVKKDIERLTELNEKKKKEEMDKMLGQLKDLGNSLLGKFGLSLDNFAMEKDPATGKYSISFKNTKK